MALSDGQETELARIPPHRQMGIEVRQLLIERTARLVRTDSERPPLVKGDQVDVLIVVKLVHVPPPFIRSVLRISRRRSVVQRLEPLDLPQGDRRLEREHEAQW
jgi:hypothetical protein